MTTTWKRELVVGVALVACWQAVVDVTTTRYTGAYQTGGRLWHFERAAHLPSEAWLQSLALHAPVLLVLATVFYMVAFWVVPVVVGLHLWRRDRTAYVEVRRLLAWSTFVGFLVAWALPCAPPRLLGVMVDVPYLLGTSEYRTRGVDVLSAFPSIHVVWAVVVAVGLAKRGQRRVGVLYVAATVAAVVVTGNHTWLDCVAAALVVAGVARLSKRRRPHVSRISSPLVEWSPAHVG